jgi:subtilisin family serine protease
LSREDGEGVVVGVFDTSPFPVAFSSVTVEMPPAPLTLRLRHPIPGGTPAGCGGFAANHGFFVAGLIHALAPAARIELIRVLDDMAQGTLFTLAEALLAFIARLGEVNARGVINLSLGLSGSDEEDAIDWDGPDLLRATLELAAEEGVVVVAAAGNDNDGAADPLPAQFPARWDFVLGVAASDSKKRRACFSNQGDVMAPGGAGVRPCRPPVDRCPDDSCPYTVISLHVGSFTGYSHGIGTSYAAPFVAGLAARLQARMMDDEAVQASGAALSEQVRKRILASARQHDGVVRVG